MNEIDSDDDHLPDEIDEDTITEGEDQTEWIVPGYDAAGNMLSGPKPGDEETRQHYKWDAWKRLVSVYADDDGEPGDLIAEYRYDALNRRIRKLLGTDPGDPDTAYDYYYNESRQLLAVRKDQTAEDDNVYQQFVWCQRYIDAPVVRFRDSNTDGDLTGGTQEGDNTLYYTNDANTCPPKPRRRQMNVTALVDASDGAVVERYMYDPYGKPKFYDSSWANPSDSSAFDNAVLYCGYFLRFRDGPVPRAVSVLPSDAGEGES